MVASRRNCRTLLTPNSTNLLTRILRLYHCEHRPLTNSRRDQKKSGRSKLPGSLTVTRCSRLITTEQNSAFILSCDDSITIHIHVWKLAAENPQVFLASKFAVPIFIATLERVGVGEFT